MSEDKVTYVELKLPKSKKQDKRYQAHKKREFPWHIIAGSLGILCFCLLLTTAFLGYEHLQSYSKSMNCPRGNITSSQEDPNYSDLSTNRDKQNPSDTCFGKWSCCGKMCYYFSEEEKNWDESKKSCQLLDSHLTKIDNEEEQKFLQQRTHYNYWVGLHKKGDKHSWMWLDGHPLSKKLRFQQTTTVETCGYIKSKHITTAACDKLFPYICEKKF